MERRCAITEEGNKKKTRYVLADEMLSSFMGSVFEKMCCQYLLRTGMTGTYSCMVTQVGTWWGTNPEKREETDIDVVGLDKSKKAV